MGENEAATGRSSHSERSEEGRPKTVSTTVLKRHSDTSDALRDVGAGGTTPHTQRLPPRPALRPDLSTLAVTPLHVGHSAPRSAASATAARWTRLSRATVTATGKAKAKPSVAPRPHDFSSSHKGPSGRLSNELKISMAYAEWISGLRSTSLCVRLGAALQCATDSGGRPCASTRGLHAFPQELVCNLSETDALGA
jgi:hypothetical protein